MSAFDRNKANIVIGIFIKEVKTSELSASFTGIIKGKLLRKWLTE